MHSAKHFISKLVPKGTAPRGGIHAGLLTSLMGPFMVRRDQPGSRAYLKLHLTRERKLPIHRDALRKRIQASNHLARYVL